MRGESANTFTICCRPATSSADSPGWYLLDPNATVKFSITGKDEPFFIAATPYILDLDAAQELDRKKMEQQLLKIIIQKMPLDKNGELIFDPEEARELHRNAVAMLGRAIGIDVLTTFAEVDVADITDKSTNTATDSLERVERSLFNAAGSAENLFNPDGNLALDKSVSNDEATLYDLVLQFERFLNDVIRPHNKKSKKIRYVVSILPTTVYNYKELAKLYKEHFSLGYSKFLPQLALGHSQSSIIANIRFENEMLDLPTLFQQTVATPPKENTAPQKSGDKKEGSGNSVGRQEKPDDQKTEKTIQNKESMS